MHVPFMLTAIAFILVADTRFIADRAPHLTALAPVDHITSHHRSAQIIWFDGLIPACHKHNSQSRGIKY